MGGYFIEPTLLNNVNKDLYYFKFFGPVAIAYKFKTDEDALNLANGLDTGLVAIFTRDLSKALLIRTNLSLGLYGSMVWFIGGLQAPNGGVK